MQGSAKFNMYRKHAVLMRDQEGDYFDVPQMDVVSMVPTEAVRILEVGCGRGATLLAIKERWAKEGRPCELVGVDISEVAVETAQERLDAAILMDAEEDEFNAYPTGYFDVIIIVFVLEHVVNPWAFLRRWAQYLRLGGHMIIGVPNISNHKFLRRLVFHDEFTHEPYGILDWTHLRYFTGRSLRQLLISSGLKIEYDLSTKFSGKRAFLCKIFPPIKHLFFAIYRFIHVAYIIRACKITEQEPDDYMPFDKVYTL